MINEYNLSRFVEAQNPVYEHALSILRRGMMCTPYLDFIFPRLHTEAGGSLSAFSIGSLDEAQANLSNRFSAVVTVNASARSSIFRS